LSGRWRRRGSSALLAVALAFVVYPLLPEDDVIDSDWPAFATGARLVVSDPGRLYDLDVQKSVENDVTGGRVLVTTGIEGILPFLAPAWVALAAVPFGLLGPQIGGHVWVLCGIACLAAGLWLAVRPRPRDAILPAFAGVPTAVFMLNAQLDGFVALGLGAALALWSRPYLAGLALGLTLMKPQLVLPLAVAVLAARRWKVLAGWAAAGLVLAVPTLVLDPRWPLDWLAQTRATVAPISREVDLPHLGVLLPDPAQTAAVAFLTVLAVGGVVLLAARRRHDLRDAAAILVAGGVLAAPHALPADMVLVSLALAAWGRARWFDWLAVSVATLVAAITPAPVPAVVGVLTIGWMCLRAAGLVSEPRPRPEPASAR
jgi:Glycosyltransferase family 87